MNSEEDDRREAHAPRMGAWDDAVEIRAFAAVAMLADELGPPDGCPSGEMDDDPRDRALLKRLRFAAVTTKPRNTGRPRTFHHARKKGVHMPWRC